jgi:26S proteasome regulatory subunit N11
MSGVDINTQQSFEALNPRAVAVVVDPVQSVKGKVVLDAFRLINPQMAMMGKEPRQHTGNIGFMQKPSIHAIVNGLNRHYYQVCVAYKKNDMEMRMLSNLHQKHWSKGLSTGKGFASHRTKNAKVIERMASLTENYASNCKEEETKTIEELANGRVGKVDPKKHLGQSVRELMSDNIDKCLVTMLNTVVF